MQKSNSKNNENDNTRQLWDKDASPETQNFLKDLDALIRIKSLLGKPQACAPFGQGPKKVLEQMASIMERCNLTPKFCEDALLYCDWMPDGENPNSIDPQDSHYVASVGHLDIVDAGDGWKTDPYILTKVNNRYVARGVLDDKGPCLAVVYALARLVNKGVKPKRRFRIVCGSNEENQSHDIPIYLKNFAAPEFSFTPDCRFPVVYAEKGIYNFVISHDISQTSANLVNIQNIEQFSPVTVPQEFQISIGQHNFVAKGRGAHTANPSSGINAITKVATQIAQDEPDIPSDLFQQFEWVAQFHNDYCGKTFGFNTLSESDDFTRCCSLVPYKINIDKTEHKFETCFTMRFPPHVSTDDFLKLMEPYSPKYLRSSAPAIVPPNHPDVLKLTEAYAKVSGTYLEPVISSGGTYAKKVPNMVSFGPMTPGPDPHLSIVHNANEWIDANHLIDLINIYEEGIRSLTC